MLKSRNNSRGQRTVDKETTEGHTWFLVEGTVQKVTTLDRIKVDLVDFTITQPRPNDKSKTWDDIITIRVPFDLGIQLERGNQVHIEGTIHSRFDKEAGPRGRMFLDLVAENIDEIK